MSRKTDKKKLAQAGSSSLIAGIALGALGLAGIGYYLFTKSQEDSQTQSTPDSDSLGDGYTESAQATGVAEVEVSDELTAAEAAAEAVHEAAVHVKEAQEAEAAKARQEEEDRQKRLAEAAAELDRIAREAEEKEKEEAAADKKRLEDAQKERIAEYRQLAIKLNKLHDYRYRDGVLKVTIVKATNVDKVDRDSESDPYCVVEAVGDSKKQKQKTKVIKNNCNPVWNDTLEFKIVNGVTDSLLVTLKDDNKIMADVSIGGFILNVVDVTAHNGHLKATFAIPQSKSGAKVQIHADYTEKE